MGRRRVYVGDPPRCPHCKRGPRQVLVEASLVNDYRNLKLRVASMLREAGIPILRRSPAHQVLVALADAQRRLDGRFVIAKAKKAKRRWTKCTSCGHKEHGQGYGCTARNCHCGELL